MALTKNFTNIINKWRIENLYYKNWRNATHSIQPLQILIKYHNFIKN